MLYRVSSCLKIFAQALDIEIGWNSLESRYFWSAGTRRESSCRSNHFAYIEYCLSIEHLLLWEQLLFSYFWLQQHRIARRVFRSPFSLVFSALSLKKTLWLSFHSHHVFLTVIVQNHFAKLIICRLLWDEGNFPSGRLCFSRHSFTYSVVNLL